MGDYSVDLSSANPWYFCGSSAGSGFTSVFMCDTFPPISMFLDTTYFHLKTFASSASTRSLNQLLYPYPNPTPTQSPPLPKPTKKHLRRPLVGDLYH